MHVDFCKSTKRVLGELAGQLYEKEMRIALAELEESFARYGRGELGPFELEEIIHKFHDGAARDLYRRYSNTSANNTAPAVAYGVARGWIALEEIPDEAREAVAFWAKAFGGKAEG